MKLICTSEKMEKCDSWQHCHWNFIFHSLNMCLENSATCTNEFVSMTSQNVKTGNSTSASSSSGLFSPCEEAASQIVGCVVRSREAIWAFGWRAPGFILIMHFSVWVKPHGWRVGGTLSRKGKGWKGLTLCNGCWKKKNCNWKMERMYNSPSEPALVALLNHTLAIAQWRLNNSDEFRTYITCTVENETTVLQI